MHEGVEASRTDRDPLRTVQETRVVPTLLRFHTVGES